MIYIGCLQATGGPLKAGERALITAAAGATGHIGVQLALLAGCHVVATCGSPAKAERLKGLGVHRVINYKDEVPVVLPHVHVPTCVSPHVWVDPSMLSIR